MADEQTTLPLIRTKLHRPPVTKNHLHRERLLDRLEKNQQRPLTLVGTGWLRQEHLVELLAGLVALRSH
jgi:hypothetical protein